MTTLTIWKYNYTLSFDMNEIPINITLIFTFTLLFSLSSFPLSHFPLHFFIILVVKQSCTRATTHALKAIYRLGQRITELTLNMTNLVLIGVCQLRRWRKVGKNDSGKRKRYKWKLKVMLMDILVILVIFIWSK